MDSLFIALLDRTHVKINVTIGVTNLVWGAVNSALMICGLLCGFGNKEIYWIIPYWGFKGAVNIANAVYRLSSVRKQKN